MQIALYSKLTTAVLTRRAAKQYDADTLTLASKLLEQNPELYTVWNYRREALQETLKVRMPPTSIMTQQNKHAKRCPWGLPSPMLGAGQMLYNT